MNIILVHKREWPSLSPSSVASTFNAVSLAERGNNVFLIVGKGNKKSSSENLKKHYGIKPIPNLHIITLDKMKRLTFSSSFPFFLKAIYRIRRIANNLKIDAVITRDTGFLPYLAKLKKSVSTKILYETHNYFLDQRTLGKSKRQIKAWYKYNKIESENIPKIDGIFCLLAPQQKLYKEKFPNSHIITTHPGVNIVDDIEPKLIKRKRLGYIGDLHKRRDIDTLFDAMSLLNDNDIDLLIIGGKDHEISRIKKLVAERKLENRIHVTGWIPYDEMSKLLKTVSVGLVPMKPTFYNRYLTAPMKIFDYMSRSIPVIAAEMESTHEFIDEGVNGIFYQPENALDLAAKIENLFSDEFKLKELRENTRTSAEMMSWQKRAQRIESLIKGTVEEEYSSLKLISL